MAAEPDIVFFSNLVRFRNLPPNDVVPAPWLWLRILVTHPFCFFSSFSPAFARFAGWLVFFFFFFFYDNRSLTQSRKFLSGLPAIRIASPRRVLEFSDAAGGMARGRSSNGLRQRPSAERKAEIKEERERLLAEEEAALAAAQRAFDAGEGEVVPTDDDGDGEPDAGRAFGKKKKKRKAEQQQQRRRRSGFLARFNPPPNSKAGRQRRGGWVGRWVGDNSQVAWKGD